jgi:hypothetical protein
MCFAQHELHALFLSVLLMSARDPLPLQLCIYLPYFLIPSLIVVRMWNDNEPFGEKAKTE